MIQIGFFTVELDDPVVWLVAAGVVFAVVVFAILLATLRRLKSLEPLGNDIGHLARRVTELGDGQQQLAGGLSHVSEAQAASQSNMLKLMEARLADVTERMGLSLNESAGRTARSLGALSERLETIDKAQAKIEALSGDVLSLQDILSNKQARGAFGEIQLNDIVGKALPADAYTLQATLSNGRRADCLIHLPLPPGPIVIDAKFPLEAYEALMAADTQWETAEAKKALRIAVRSHIKAISERYLIEGETADGALMFLPSEAIYAELHANFGDVVREGFEARVWIVSPTTCMATLNTLRSILKDARMREQAGAIRKELGLLYGDVGRLETRVGNLDRHFAQASKDVDEIRISAEKAGKRARRLEAFDFDEDDQPPVIKAAE